MQKIALDIIVDSCFMGDINPSLKGNPVDISECVELMKKNYKQISPDYEEDNVITTIWVKKGEFVPQEVLKHITFSIINN